MSILAMNQEVTPERFRLLGGGCDNLLGAIPLVKTESKMELTASSTSSPYVRYFILVGFGALFFGLISLRNPGSDFLSLRGLLFFSPVFIAIWVMAVLAGWCTRHRELKILPLLVFEGSTLIRVRETETRMECGAVERYFIPAFHSPHGEFVELQLQNGNAIQCGPKFFKDSRSDDHARVKEDR